MLENSLTEKTQRQQNEEKFNWLVSFMVFHDPFSHEILMLMDKKPSKKHETMGIEVKDHEITLWYNPDFFQDLTIEESRFVFQHEVFHVALHHCTHRRPTDPRQKKIFDLACDLAVNSLIKTDAGVKAPKGIAHPDQFKFPPKFSVEQYMELLRDLNPPQCQSDDGEGEGEEGDNEAKGSAPGAENADEEGEGEGDPKPGGEGGTKVKQQFDDHGGWEESELLDQNIRNKIEDIQRSNSWGSVSGDVQAIIEAAQRPQVNWRGLLRRYLGQIPSPHKTSTFKRPNRRFGYPYSGTKREHLDKALFAIDTSGSIEDENLSQFLAELNRFVEQYPADLVLFDTTITYGPKPFTRKNNYFTFTGRGGTCVDDVFKVAKEGGYKSVVFLTDGCFAEPEPPGNMDVVWVITESGHQPVPWGKYVQLTHTSKRGKSI